MDPTTHRLMNGSAGHLENPLVSITGYANSCGVGYGGDGVISWTSQDVINQSINEGIGAVASSGSLTVSYAGQTKTFTITGTTSSGATITSSVTITFCTPEAPPPPPPFECTMRERMRGNC